MNIENVNKLIDHLESIHEIEYDQKRYIFECGSPACIAGHAVYLAKGKKYDIEDEDCHISLIAGNWLGINKVAKRKMFHAFYWGHYQTGSPPTKQDAINMLKNFLETGEVVWREENEY